jgi:hypothetical protein
MLAILVLLLIKKVLDQQMIVLIMLLVVEVVILLQERHPAPRYPFLRIQRITVTLLFQLLFHHWKLDGRQRFLLMKDIIMKQQRSWREMERYLTPLICL